MADSNPDVLHTFVLRRLSEQTTALPAQSLWQAPPVDWNDYDVPRIWDSLNCVDHDETWEQGRVIARQAEALNAQADELVRIRERLAGAWSGGQTPAAIAALGKIDWLINALRADARAASTTARGVDGVLDTMKSARRAMEPIAREWLGITRTDSRGWRARADGLNNRAREIMFTADAMIRDHRTNIVVPAKTDAKIGVLPRVEDLTTKTGSLGNWPSTVNVKGPSPVGAVSPGSVGGFPADVEPPDEAGPAPAGQPVPGLSSGTASALPIFPGSSYAPRGGAFVMPNGVGSSGYITQMPAMLGTAGQNLGPSGGAPPGMMPMPMPMGGHTPNTGTTGASRSAAGTRWEVRQGGPAVIAPGPGDAAALPPVDPDPDEFREWFAETAMPWRVNDEPGGQAPIVTIRRGAV